MKGFLIMRKMHYIPLLGGFFGALGVMAAVALAPYMPTQAELAPEETALLAEWSKVGDALSVQRMVEHGACVEAADAEGTTALMTAAAEGHMEVVKVLLMHNAQVNATNREGDTALHFAVRNNEKAITAYLLEQGAAVNAQNKAGVTPLMVASWSGFEQLVQQLLTAGADTELPDEDGAKASTHAREVQDDATRERILQLLGA